MFNPHQKISVKEIISGESFYLILIILGFFLYYLKIAYMFFWLAAILLKLCRCNRLEIGFFSILVGSNIFGRIFASQALNIGFVSALLCVGIILLYKEIFNVVSKNITSMLFLIIFLTYFYSYYLFGPQNEYAISKIFKLSVRIIAWTIAFLIYSQIGHINNKRISVMFLLLTMFYLSQAFELYGIKPSSIFDVTYFRYVSTYIIGRNEANTAIVNYHSLAYMALASYVFWIIGRDIFSGGKHEYVVVVVLCFWIIVISGARQCMFAFGIITIVRYIVGHKNIFSLSNIVFTTIFVLLFVLILGAVGSSYFDSALTNEDVGMGDRLHRDTTTPFEVMDIDPTFGVGFGAYPLYANKDYPHNFFIEVLCESGWVGLIMFIVLLLSYYLCNQNKTYLKYMTVGQSYLFILFLLFFLRAQISGDYTSSVSFISVLLSFSVPPKIYPLSK